MVNQGSEDEEYETWIDWWEWNKDKTQTDWIREGFQLRGIIVSNPLTTETTMTLLHVLTSTNEPRWFKFNAKRWLRDSGFRAWRFDLESVPPSERPTLTRTLLNFAAWQGLTVENPGKLFFLKQTVNDRPVSDSRYTEPLMFRPWTGTVVSSIITLLAAGGGWLLLCRRLKS